VVMRGVNSGEVQGRLVRSLDPSLREIRLSGDMVLLGAGVTMAQILAHRDLGFLHDVARSIGGPQVRNMATVGGNLFAPHPYGDFATALLALGARVQVVGSGSARSLDDLLRERAHASPVLVAAIEFARPRDPRSFGYLKVSRVKPKGVSVMSLAVLLARDGGRIRGARVAYGAMGPVPLRAAAVERALDGRTLDPETIAAAVRVAAEGIDPPTDPIASSWYRREVVGVHLRRLLERLV
jgi:CO/xanthine dehydrogenase FAD-binding subunit